ncbi:MAG: DUF4388 domain-containing protein, partial [Deltaproteobacteria bacterium]|nr:DUF4388 domain-containing protein [Deltaproteobacteria bacterium]
MRCWRRRPVNLAGHPRRQDACRPGAGPAPPSCRVGPAGASPARWRRREMDGRLRRRIIGALKSRLGKLPLRRLTDKRKRRPASPACVKRRWRSTLAGAPAFLDAGPTIIKNERAAWLGGPTRRQANAGPTEDAQPAEEPLSTPTLLLVDGDPRSRRLMEVSLRKAGYQVLAVPDAETVQSLALDTPLDLIISDTELPGRDGFELRRRILELPRWASLPFLFLTREGEVEDRRRGLELGVQEYLTRPIFVKEVVAKVQILLRKQGSATAAATPAVPSEGSLEEMGLVDLLQVVLQAKASGVVYLAREEFRGRIYLRQGQVVDAKVGKLDGEEAFFRLLRWPDGRYTVDPREVRQRPRINRPLGELLDEGLALFDECHALLARLPPHDPVMKMDLQRMAQELERLPTQVGDVLRLFDGVRNISRVLEDSLFPDRETLYAALRLFEQGLIVPVSSEAEEEGKRSLSAETSSWLKLDRDTAPLHRLHAPAKPETLVEAARSGTTQVLRLPSLTGQPAQLPTSGPEATRPASEDTLSTLAEAPATGSAETLAEAPATGSAETLAETPATGSAETLAETPST